MKKPAKVRKPEPFRILDRWAMQCCDLDGDRFIESNTSQFVIMPREVPRLRRWLARAERWCKQGGGA